jgi:aspartyl-tRNA(Asn)/glutamyl-tRNA(Gln) amidotransferase subunit A
MAKEASPLQKLRAEILNGATSPRELAERALAKSNQNAGHNVYISRDENWTLREADLVHKGLFSGEPDRAQTEFSKDEFPSKEKPPLFGLPISLKDCFDLEGFRTTAGTRYYAEKNEIAREDSAVAKRLRAQGAIITGKTNLHPLAYGITGENPDFGDCLQPANANLLTGGSTSGGAASVQEGSAVAAIGTDTGGSIRVPAALCGLAGYRASIGLAWDGDLWRGGLHLAQSFDTLGWIFRDLCDAPLLAEGLFGLQVPRETNLQVKVGAISSDFLHDCDANVLAAFASCEELLRASGADVQSFAASYWDDALSIYAPIQASEAAAIHAAAIKAGATAGNYSCFPTPPGCENFSHFPKAISERLTWGASLSIEEVNHQRQRHTEFRKRVDKLFESFDFLILPCSPISKLEANKDHTQTRPTILRYTTPLSLAGTPVVTLPFPNGAGIQLTAPRGQDSRLLACAAALVI